MWPEQESLLKKELICLRWDASKTSNKQPERGVLTGGEVFIFCLGVTRYYAGTSLCQGSEDAICKVGSRGAPHLRKPQMFIRPVALYP